MTRVIGILGGMGPRATVQFEQMLLDRLPGTDQQIPTIISLNDGTIPDRSRFLLGGGASPLPKMQHNLRLLERAGADIVCLPCNTACAPRLFGRLRTTTSRLVDLPQEVADYISARGLRRICLLATEGTVRAGTYQTLLAWKGTECIVPAPALQQRISTIIALVKNGELRRAEKLARLAAADIETMRCDGVLLGCTELPLVKTALVPGSCTAVDTLAILADAAVRYTYEQKRTRLLLR